MASAGGRNTSAATTVTTATAVAPVSVVCGPSVGPIGASRLFVSSVCAVASLQPSPHSTGPQTRARACVHLFIYTFVRLPICMGRRRSAGRRTIAARPPLPHHLTRARQGNGINTNGHRKMVGGTSELTDRQIDSGRMMMWLVVIRADGRMGGRSVRQTGGLPCGG